MADAVDLLAALPALERRLLKQQQEGAPLLPHQHPPEEPWTYWMLMAGRGSGKTFAGSRWLDEKARQARVRVAVVGPTQDDARETCVEGVSGLLAVNPSIRFVKPHTLIWPNGSRGRIFGAYHPEDVERFRGPQHHYAWCDELASWRMLAKVWPMLRLGLRLGARPQAMITTTPKPRPTFMELLRDAGSEMTTATTDDNPYLAEVVRQEFYDLYGGTELGRQELQAELLEESSDAVVQLAWVWQAVERDAKSGGLKVAGLDIARFGSHKTAITICEDTHLIAMEERRGQGLMATVGWVLDYVERFEIQALGLDDTGLGGGVTDRLAELISAGECRPFTLVPVHFASVASEPKRFHNVASEMWWRLRTVFKPDAAMPMVLPGHHPLLARLESQLSGARYALDSNRRIWVDKTGGGHYGGREEGEAAVEGAESPDLADALCLAMEAWSVYYQVARAPARRVSNQESVFG